MEYKELYETILVEVQQSSAMPGPKGPIINDLLWCATNCILAANGIIQDYDDNIGNMSYTKEKILTASHALQNAMMAISQERD